MAAHVYLSAVARAPGDPPLPATTEMRYRGETGPGDDPVSYAQKMRAAGHEVRIVDEFIGAAVTLAAFPEE